MNVVNLVGNLGKDPEIRSFDNGGKVAEFSLATREWAKDGNYTEWHNCKVNREGIVGVVEQYVKKGSKIAVTGRLKTRSWDQNGEKKYRTEIIVSDLEMLDSKGESKEAAASESPTPAQTIELPEDDIPF